MYDPTEPSTSMQCRGPTTQQMRQPGSRQFLVRPLTMQIGSVFTSWTNSADETVLNGRVSPASCAEIVPRRDASSEIVTRSSEIVP